MPSNTTRLVSKSPSSTRLSAARTTRTGVAVIQAATHIRTKPKNSAAAAEISTATANCVWVRLRSNSTKNAIIPMPMTGSPELSIHTVMMRPMIPGANRRGAGPAASACAATGRSVNSVAR